MPSALEESWHDRSAVATGIPVRVISAQEVVRKPEFLRRKCRGVVPAKEAVEKLVQNTKLSFRDGPQGRARNL